MEWLCDGVEACMHSLHYIHSLTHSGLTVVLLLLWLLQYRWWLICFGGRRVGSIHASSNSGIDEWMERKNLPSTIDNLTVLACRRGFRGFGLVEVFLYYTREASWLTQARRLLVGYRWFGITFVTLSFDWLVDDFWMHSSSKTRKQSRVF